ncbi:glycoside hydrolase domain-containing protein [Desulfosporosinus sp. FKB]|uniref:glycoside hydrolase domain-containing protein n=1 Tax=Desulfosporosinus sp. FKB TaxID=1969835 RepID=UPI000B4A0A7F|nr:glycoside hydrolase domain-containing protein [Desulfosporosinus sp. FKB]
MYGIDCATRLTAANVQALKSAGVKAVGRYLGGNYGLTAAEVKSILDAGLALWLILELDPTKASYFNYLRGVSDAQYALAQAQALGVLKGVCIYFAVDFEAQPGDMSTIKEYFRGVHMVLTGKYQVGVYGSFAVLKAMKGADYPPDKFFQTYAWSYGDKAPNHIYQYSNNVLVAGFKVDQDYVNEDAGLWTAEATANTTEEKGSEEVLDVAVLMDTEEDFWSAIDVSRRNGNCALFVRVSHNATPPADAMKAVHLIVVGGATTGHPNETLLSGDDKFGTAAAVKKYLG